MSTIIKEEGYKYAFDYSACSTCEGKCCTGESGYIYLNQNEMEGIATFLELSMGELKENYLFKNGECFCEEQGFSALL